jgi:hypothetical protein
MRVEVTFEPESGRVSADRQRLCWSHVPPLVALRPEDLSNGLPGLRARREAMMLAAISAGSNYEKYALEDRPNGSRWQPTSLQTKTPNSQTERQATTTFAQTAAKRPTAAVWALSRADRAAKAAIFAGVQVPLELGPELGPRLGK